jgi:hypothetical protein
MQPSPSPARRAFNPDALEAHVAGKKLRSAKVVAGGQPVTLPPDEFVPVIRAEVGSEAARSVYSYRVLLPIAQIIRESADAFRRVTVASRDDVAGLRGMLIRHFGGVTMNVLDPSPLRGIGARDPQKPQETEEENEHIAFEVYAAPLQESDDYFRALRKELQQALGEGVILIQRQEVMLL